MVIKDIKIKDANILILGFTFKENCPDVRNTRVIDIYNELISFDISVDIYDPLANGTDVQKEYKINILNEGTLPTLDTYSAIILAVGHKEFQNLNITKSDSQVIFDVKGLLNKEQIDARL
jgi:UDP-N-acetyl-D-galactosamine dehydrogenase